MDEAGHRSMAAAQDAHWWYRGRRALLRGLLQRRFPARRDLRLLEIGAGTGGNLAVLTEFGTVTAVEPAAFAAGIIAAQHPQVRIVQSTWPAAAQQLGEFDVVCLLDVLEHLDDDVDALRSLHAHIKPTGIVIVSVPAYMSMWSQHDVELWHRRRYSRAALHSAVTNAGFSVSFISGFNAMLFPVAWLARRLHLPGATGDALPHPSLNAVFAAILRCEAFLVARGVPLPFGLSMVAVLRRS